MTMPNKAHALGRDELIASLRPWHSYATADGTPAGTTIVDARLIGSNDFLTGSQVQILFGPALWERQTCTSFNPITGTMTFSTGFSAQITALTNYGVLTSGAISASVIANFQKITPDGVYIDTVNGVPGTDWPTGTPGQPSNNEADTLAIAAARGLTTIYVRGGFTLPAGFSGPTTPLCFIGRTDYGWGGGSVRDIVDMNGQDATNCYFKDLVIQGLNSGGGNALFFDNCTLDSISSASNIVMIGGRVRFGFNLLSMDLAITLFDPVFEEDGGIGSACDLDLAGMDGPPGAHSKIYGAKGLLRIINFTNVGTNPPQLDIYGNGLNLTIDVSCTGGEINLYGDISLTNISGGTVVNDKTGKATAILPGLDVPAGEALLYVSNLVVTDDLHITAGASLEVLGKLQVNGTILNEGALTCQGLDCSWGIDSSGLGNVTIEGNCQVAQHVLNSGGGNITINGKLDINGDSSAGEGYLDNTGGGNITIDGDTFIPGNLTNPAAVITIDGILRCYGTITNTGTLTYEVLNPEKVLPLQIVPTATTIDLNQAAGNYNLWTGSSQVVLLESLVIRMSGGAIAGAVTSISIQTDDATPQVIIPATLGIVANLTNEAQLTWDAGTQGPIYVKVGKHVQLTINGGAAGVARVCDVVAEFRPVVAGGTLA